MRSTSPRPSSTPRESRKLTAPSPVKAITLRIALTGFRACSTSPSPSRRFSLNCSNNWRARLLKAVAPPATEAAMKVFEFDVEAWMAKAGIVVKKARTRIAGGRRWTLTACPFDSSHTDGGAAIIQSATGVLGFRRQHNGCRGNPARRNQQAKGGKERRQEQLRAAAAVCQALRHAGVRLRSSDDPDSP